MADKYTDFIERLHSEDSSIDEKLIDIQKTVKVKHVIYHMARLGAKAIDDPFIRLTYSPEWIKRYLTRGYMRVDPVIRIGFESTLPFAWNEIELSNKKEQRFFKDALNFDVGQSGFSVPLRDKHGRRALFSISSDLTGPEWKFFFRTTKSLLIEVANIIHRQAVLVQGQEFYHPPLTNRELEVLYWSAQSKTMADIATILGLAINSVTTYCQGARHKLNSTSVTQAVYRAQNIGLLELGNMPIQEVRQKSIS